MHVWAAFYREEFGLRWGIPVENTHINRHIMTVSISLQDIAQSNYVVPFQTQSILINTFIQQGYIKLIKCDRDIFNGTKYIGLFFK